MRDAYRMRHKIETRRLAAVRTVLGGLSGRCLNVAHYGTRNKTLRLGELARNGSSLPYL